MQPSSEKFEELAKELEKHEEFRVIRKLNPAEIAIKVPANGSRKRGLFVDVETTGLINKLDEIIELGVVPFEYSDSAEICRLCSPNSWLREPSRTIPTTITALPGITDEMVKNQTVDIIKLDELVEGTDLIVAHNARFDRPFLEELSPAFARKPWACSMSQIDWAARGFEGRKLSHLALEHGFFYNGHRATDDCLAGLKLLNSADSQTGRRPFEELLDNARKPTWRIWALGAPFEQKDLLKSRGYHWNNGENGKLRAWNIEVSEGAKDEEVEFLSNSVFGRSLDLPIDRVTAFERFSDR